MSTSLVHTVLEIEQEADAILAKAAQDAERVVAEAKAQVEAASRTSQEAVEREIAESESRATAEKNKKVKELQDAGDQVLARVKDIPDSRFDQGVEYIMNALKG